MYFSSSPQVPPNILGKAKIFFETENYFADCDQIIIVCKDHL